MQIKKWFLLTLAAILYAIPFLASQYTWWLVFIFPLPFFIAALTYNLSWKEGFFWTGLAFTLHVSGIAYSTVQSVTGSYLVRVVPFALLIFSFALAGAFCFGICHYIERLCNKRESLLLRLGTWIAGLWFLFVYFDLYALSPLWLFERFEGNFLMLPLLPLAWAPQLLYSLAYIPKFLLLIFVFLPAASVAAWYVSRNEQWGVVFCIMAFPWIFMYGAREQTVPQPIWLKHVVCLQKKFINSPNLLAGTRRAARELSAIIKQYPEVELVVIPESACSLVEISCEPILTRSWQASSLGKPINIIFGGYRWAGEKYCNTLHWFTNEKLRALADKRHAMLLTERLPYLFEKSALYDSYFADVPLVDISKEPRKTFDILPGVTFVPYICSELFFNQQPDDDFRFPVTIVAICGDSWSRHPYIGTLMFLMARLRAIEWQRDILYCSYQYAALATKKGVLYDVRTKD